MCAASAPPVLFWALHALMLSLFALILLRHFQQVASSRRKVTQDFRRRQRWEDARRRLAAGETPEFLRISDQLAFEILAEKLEVPTGKTTRRTILRKGASRLPPDLMGSAREIFDAYAHLYSGASHPSADNKKLLEAMSRVIKAA